MFKCSSKQEHTSARLSAKLNSATPGDLPARLAGDVAAALHASPDSAHMQACCCVKLFQPIDLFADSLSSAFLQCLLRLPLIVHILVARSPF